LAFSVGAHFCLGAPLAKLEAVSLTSALLQREPSLRLVNDQKIAVTASFAFRGPKSLVVQRT
jgi:cytochrome P450